MNLLIVLGNAIVDYRFRRLLLQDPLGTVEAYGFRLTKFEAEMLQAALKDSVALEQCFKTLEDQLYRNIESKPIPYLITDSASDGPAPSVTSGCRQRPCSWSLTVPAPLQEAIKKIA